MYNFLNVLKKSLELATQAQDTDLARELHQAIHEIRDQDRFCKETLPSGTFQVSVTAFRDGALFSAYSFVSLSLRPEIVGPSLSPFLEKCAREIVQGPPAVAT